MLYRSRTTITSRTRTSLASLTFKMQTTSSRPTIQPGQAHFPLQTSSKGPIALFRSSSETKQDSGPFVTWSLGYTTDVSMSRARRRLSEYHKKVPLVSTRLTIFSPLCASNSSQPYGQISQSKTATTRRSPSRPSSSCNHTQTQQPGLSTQRSCAMCQCMRCTPPPSLSNTGISTPQ
ncbi:hypothetical protein CC86DRAFT_141074 [Ophiobolus disseminans]|uniref:Uncharacterized protein n=1 Tax=Ophiobolus disseminans TaxID=1469910 RepID=A0A6A7AEI5_9PLEO|nr:hypothetical protein CC86DRAFT_141074 [Ophiobolus disseminans]